MDEYRPAENDAEFLLRVVDERSIYKALEIIRVVGNYKNAVYHLKFRLDNPTDLPFFQSTYPPQWVGRYIQQQYSEIDPIVLEGFSKKKLFLWSDFKKLTKKQKEFFDEAAEYGVGRVGASVPLTDKEKRSALFSVTSDMDQEEWAEKIARETPLLNQIGDILHRRAIMHLYGDDTGMTLSPREIECLNWTAKGKDGPAIASILGISEFTTRDYIKSARLKLGCSTTAQTIYEATKRRIIDI